MSPGPVPAIRKTKTMIKDIKFDHEGERIDALLIYNFESVCDLIEVRPVAFLVSTQLLFFEELPGQWVTTDPIVHKFPATFASIRQQLENLFVSYHYSFLGRTGERTAQGTNKN